MQVVVIDARDSFVHILADYLGTERDVEAIVLRPDKIGEASAISAALDPRTCGIVLGPGPGHPADSCHMSIAEAALGTKPILGVCLGHQALALVAGGSVRTSDEPRHGRLSELAHTGAGLFRDLSQKTVVARYHSLVVDPPTVGGGQFEVVATAVDDDAVMGIEIDGCAHGVQFHPESHGSPSGRRIIANFVARVSCHADPRATGLVAHETSPALGMDVSA